MIVKRPAGCRPESPKQVRDRLLRTWPGRVERHLGEVGDDRDDWPLEVNIGRPRLTGEALVANAVENRTWIESWRAMGDRQDVRIEEKSTRRAGHLRIPASIVFADIDALARFLGAGAENELETARARFGDLTIIDPRLSGMAPNWRGIAEMSEAEHAGTCEFLSLRSFSADEIVSIREMLIDGLDGKFLETRRRILEDALSHIGKLKEGRDFRERLGFRSDDRQTLWIKTHPSDMAGPFGATQFAVRPSAVTDLPSTIRQVAIVENIETFFSHDPLAGVCLFFGGGNAISGMAGDIAPLAALDVAYWGDLDTFGMKILSRLRRVVPHVRSVMMDEATLTGMARQAWRHEPESDRYTGEITRLTAAEKRALDLLRAGNHRIEQEHLRPGPEDLCRIGLQRAGCA